MEVCKGKTTLATNSQEHEGKKGKLTKGGRHGQTMPKFLLVRMNILAFFSMEFLGCILFGVCVYAILGILSGLKEEFYGEIKWGFLGFWIEKEA